MKKRVNYDFERRKKEMDRQRKKEAKLQDYFLLHGMEGELNRMLGRTQAARKAFARALICALNGAERRFAAHHQ